MSSLETKASKPMTQISSNVAFWGDVVFLIKKDGGDVRQIFKGAYVVFSLSVMVMWETSPLDRELMDFRRGSLFCKSQVSHVSHATMMKSKKKKRRRPSSFEICICTYHTICVYLER